MLSHSHPLFRIFPPPSFLALPATGLDLKDRSIKFIELSRKGKYYELANFGEAQIPSGIIVRGEIKDVAKLKKILEDFKKKYGIHAVHVSLPEQPGYILHARIQQMPQKSIRENLFSEIKRHVPLSVEEAIFDYHVSPNPNKDGLIYVAIAVIPKNIALSYLSLFKESGIKPLSFEFGAHAILRASLPPQENSTVMLVDIGAAYTGIAVVTEGSISFTASINMGGDAITSAIAKHLSIGIEEASVAKKSIGLKKTSGDMDLINAIIPPLSTIRDEIKRYFLYWHSHIISAENNDNYRIKKILISGEEAGVPGVTDYLKGSLGGDISVVNPWININPLIDHVPELQHNRALGFTTTFGLALRSFL